MTKDNRNSDKNKSDLKKNPNLLKTSNQKNSIVKEEQNTVFKKEFFDKVLEIIKKNNSNITSKELSLIFKCIKETIVDILRSGEKLSIMGYFTISIKELEGENIKVKNPSYNTTGEGSEYVEVKYKKRPKVKIGEKLKKLVNFPEEESGK